MNDATDDDTFSTADRTSQLPRVRRHSTERTRTHRVVAREDEPVADAWSDSPPEYVDDDSAGLIWFEKSGLTERLGALSTINPRLLSVGAVALAGILAVPLFGALSDSGEGDNDAFRTVAEAESTTTEPLPPPTTAVVTAAANPEISGSVEAPQTPSYPDDTESEASANAAAGWARDLNPRPDCANAYTAEAGDYWLLIADRSGVSLGELLALNDADVETAIYPGSTICLPGGADTAADAAPAAPAAPTAADCGSTYEAAAGDYWLLIADRSGVSLDELLAFNDAGVETAIYPGSTICLPDGATVAASPQTSSSSTSTSTSSSTSTSTSSSSTAAACASAYEAGEGDYWLRIADTAGVELDDLLSANQATADTPLYPGSEVCLPAGAANPAPPTTAVASTASPTTSNAPATTQPPTTRPPTTPATTEAPATTEPPPPVPPTAPATASEIQQIIRDVWPDDLEERALLIAWRESSYNPAAQNFCCSGLFQIYYGVHAGWLADMGIDSREDLYDPRANAEAAYVLYQRSGGWEPWLMTAY